MKNSKLILSILFISSLISSCTTVGKAVSEKNTIESGAIPPEFGRTVQTFVILVNKDSKDPYAKYHSPYAKLIEKFVAEGYTGNYQISALSEMDNLINEDSEKFRYFYYYDISTDIRRSNGESFEVAVRQFYVLDASDKKQYYNVVKTSAYGKLTRAYMKVLDAERLKN